jgi:hypothetical protein
MDSKLNYMSERKPPIPKEKKYGELKGPYRQKTVIERIEALFLDNIGKVVTREMLIQVARDPETGRNRENWHQRLSELRTDYGYTILSYRDWNELKPGEYVMPTSEKRTIPKRRLAPTSECWRKVLERADYRCEWNDDGNYCGLEEGETDPVGGGTVHLTPDHKLPYSMGGEADPNNPDHWRALCGRHQVMKKNYWDTLTGKLNYYAIVQAAPKEEKRKIYDFLKQYFGGD